MDIVKSYFNVLNEIKNISNKKDIKLIVVTKSFSLDYIRPIINLGHIHFGENRVNEAMIKWFDEKKLNSKIKIHLIGKLQSNKVRDALKIFSYVHSLDSKKLALLLDKEQKIKNIFIKYFVQVNIGNEKQKSGIPVDEVNSFIEFCKNNTQLNIIGLMCIPPINKSPVYYFKILSQLAKNNHLNELSMGMSSDYKEAVQSGSTYLRLGSIIFGSRIS